MNIGRVDINMVEAPGVIIQDVLDPISVDINLQGIIDLCLAPDNVSDHGALAGLLDDDHTQYFNQARGDARYERGLGNPVADDYILSSKANGTRSWIIPPAGGGGTGVEYHNALLGIQGGAPDDYYHLTANLYNAFEYVPNGGNPYFRVKLPLACDYEIQAYSDTGWLPPTIWESMPVATTSSVGGIQLPGGTTTFLRGDGSWQVPPGGSGGMVYPGAGIARSTGSAWAASLTDNSSHWNEAYTWTNANGANAVTAFGWGNHALAGYLTGISKSMVEAVLTGSITSHTHPTVNTANFSIVQESGKLVIKYGSTVIFSISAAGYVKALDEIESKTTP